VYVGVEPRPVEHVFGVGPLSPTRGTGPAWSCGQFNWDTPPLPWSTRLSGRLTSRLHLPYPFQHSFTTLINLYLPYLTLTHYYFNSVTPISKRHQSKHQTCAFFEGTVVTFKELPEGRLRGC
jgi:hypothetical protein